MRQLSRFTISLNTTVAILAALLLTVAPAYGQDATLDPAADAADAPDAGEASSTVAPNESAKTVTDAPADSAPESAAAADVAALKQAFSKELLQIREEYDTRIGALETAAYQQATENSEEKQLRVFGFYDLAFLWRHIGKGAFFNEGDGFVNTSPQFLMQHLNLYFASQLTSTLSFLTEVQFSFLPNGASGIDFWDGERQDTRVVDPYTQQQYRWGSIMIQRAWLKWEPAQFFGVKAGYYLTPYGIWHEDHASTARISILPPFENDTVTPAELSGRKAIPPSQLGLQLYGRLFPADSLRFDYAFTVSNGRGPADTVVDYDDNKGLGLRLKLTWSRPNVEVALGSYGYYGEYTDKLVESWNEEVLENYKEYALASDFLLGFFGVRIQAEYIRSLAKYSKGGRPAAVFNNGDVILSYAPDTVASYFYGLLAYQLPLDKWLNGKTLTPYFGVEFDIPRDEIKDFSNMVLNAGLNFKPSPVVALKLEGSRLEVKWLGDSNATIWTAASQLAVSF